MLPAWFIIISYLFVGISIQLLGILFSRLSKRIGYIVEITIAISAVVYIFIQYPFLDSFIYIAFVSSGYASTILLTANYDKYTELKSEIKNLDLIKIDLTRNIFRILIDVTLAFVVFIGAITFLIYGPTSSPLKFIIAYGMVSAISEIVKRTITFASINVYYNHEKDSLLIVSPLNSRQLPLEDLQTVTEESSVDILRLHPYFTLFSSTADFTTSLDKVLKLQFSGETIHLTFKDTIKWRTVFDQYLSDPVELEEITILPFYHRKNLKRLLGKLYFAMTVKGISAYSGLLLVLYYFDLPVFIMIPAILVYWFVNLYFSDRILQLAMDAKPTVNPEVIESARRIFKKANISQVQVYETESTEYNGLATGVHIGRSMVTLTTATLQLPLSAIEGILAHEAVHVQKRDVMWGQVWKMAYFIVLFFGIVFLFNHQEVIMNYKIPLFFAIWFIMILFPIYQSFYTQRMEVRADHLGATFLNGSTEQMAQSLSMLARNQDNALQKSVEYSAVNSKKLTESSLDRPSWIWRFLEFQFMPHPPMYWRVEMLKQNKIGWNKSIRRQWFFDRFRESFLKS
ncbi:M56 family metallopeptidase [Aquibacillus kalidii]|uniref:M56 family metallopeptidase n=1 Tax=Aquibacillus kalidii TaxID=2762597 RepID=UPI0016447E62|nr:M56 family metallopeptidase [Aquibacillus kalidii]